MFNYAKYKLRFDNITINSDRRMIAGRCVSVSDPNEGQITGLDDILEGGVMYGRVKDGITKAQVELDFTVDSLTVFAMENGELSIENSQGQTAVFDLTGENGDASTYPDSVSYSPASVLPVTVKDAEGNLYRVERSDPDDPDKLTATQIGKSTETLTEAYPDQTMELVDSNNVTPFYGDKFRKDATVSIILAAILVILYVWYSFRKIHGLSAGFMSLVALLHDVLIVFFTFTIFKIPIGDSFVAVALAILGYSINDTIVIYDRIRENSRREISRKDKMPVEGIVDKSISQSVARSINTNLAVFASIAVLYVFAAINNLDTIVSFALPMAIGSISGCYSTICIVGPLWAAWEKRKQRKLAAAKG